MVFCTSHVEKLSPKCVDFWLGRYCYCCSYLYYVIVLLVWSTPVSVLELVWWISLSVYVGNLQKLCKTLDGDQALREAKEREDEKTVNDEEMAERSVNTLTTYCSAVAECRRSVMPPAHVDQVMNISVLFARTRNGENNRTLVPWCSGDALMNIDNEPVL